MRKICTAVTLVAAVLAGGSAMASAAAATPVRLLPTSGSADCGPMRDGDTTTPATSQSQDNSGQPRKERSAWAGNYCSDDSGNVTRTDPRRPGAPASTQSQGTAHDQNQPPNAQTSPEKPADGGSAAGRTGPMA